MKELTKPIELPKIKEEYQKLVNLDDKEIEETKTNNVLISYEKTKEDQKRNGLDVYHTKHTVDATWAIGDDEYLNLFSTIALDEGYTSFANIQRHNLHETGCYEFSFVNAANEKVAELSTVLNGVKLAGKDHEYKFNKDTITCNDMVIDNNLRLVKIGDQMVPSMQTILSFNADHDLSRIKKHVEHGKFHTVSKEIINSLDGLYADKVRFFDRVKSFYSNEVMDIKTAMDIKKRAEAGLNNLLTTEEINTCVELMREAIKEKQNEPKDDKGTALQKNL